MTEIHSLSFTTDGRWLASLSENDNIKIWDTLTGDCKQEIENETGEEVKISGDGQLVASGWVSVDIWETRTGRLVRKLDISLHVSFARYLSCLDFSKDGTLLAVGSYDCIYMYNTATGDLAWKTSRTGGAATSLAFSPDSERLATAFSDRTIKIWDLTKSNESMASSGSAQSLCYSDEHHFAAYYPDCQEIATWGRSAGNEVEVQKFRSDNVSIITMSKDHRQIASASSSGQVTIWETKTGARTHIFDADSVDAKGDNRGDNIDDDDESGRWRGKITSLAFRNSLQLACGSWETIRILNTSDGTTAQTHHEANILVNLMEVATDGQWLAYRPFRPGAEDKHVHSFRIWNTATEKCLPVPESDSMYGHITSLSFSMDGQLLASSSHRSIRLWDVTTGHCIRELKTYGYFPVAFFDAGIIRRLNTQFGFLAIEVSGPGCLGPSSLDAGIYGDTGAAAQGLEKAPYAEDSRESSWLDFCGYGFSTEFDWLVLDGRRLLRIPPDYRANKFSQITPIINQSALIWISKTGRLVRLYFPPRH